MQNFDSDTIYALSSGSLPSGVAIVRISGTEAFSAVSRLTVGRFERESVESRKLVRIALYHPVSNDWLDDALVVGFFSPASFTGEDVVELHCHGGRATISAILDALSHVAGCRAADAGEFSRRAFSNGKMDLTSLEGLSDLIVAETENQRKLALSQSSGALADLYTRWRSSLIRSRALIEAELDFSDEEDIPDSVSDQVWSSVSSLLEEVDHHLNDQNKGEIVRDGFRITLLGAPNSGKSSLLNALAQRNVAIVTDQAGTTRDVLEVNLDIGGYKVVISDTAGLRETDDIVEQEGIKRARQSAKDAELVFWLSPSNGDFLESPSIDFVPLRTKSDLSDRNPSSGLQVSVKTETGLDELIVFISNELNTRLGSGDDVLMTRQRHRSGLLDCRESLMGFLEENLEIELRSECLRQASDSLGRLTGRIDVEDLLDVIFSEFCVGK